jgi:hypothetical protein
VSVKVLLHLLVGTMLDLLGKHQMSSFIIASRNTHNYVSCFVHQAATTVAALLEHERRVVYCLVMKIELTIRLVAFRFLLLLLAVAFDSLTTDSSICSSQKRLLLR